MADRGSGARCAIGKESNWGTAVADTMLLNFTSEGLKLNVEKVQEDSLLAAKAAPAYDLMGMSASGPVSVVLKPENAGLIIKAALGGTDTVTVVTGQQVHTIIAQSASSALPSYTLMVDRKVAIKRYSGAMVQSLKLAAKVKDYVRATIEFLAKDESTGTITSSTAPSLRAYKMIGGTFTLGAVAHEVASFELDYQNNLEPGPQTNVSGLYITQPMQGPRRIGFTIETPYASASETLRESNYKTETLLSSCVFHLESPEIIATTYKYRMDITLNNVAILDASVNVNDAGIMMITIKGEATQVGATEPISAVVYDNVATAY